jgi:gamma-glutamylaminecyclotransferase|tara:strand:- start:25 stop:402 length:378 start_codon:yes stop_codon:yes gene_type:complete
MTKILVYGTLRSGLSNHHYMNGCKLIGKGKTNEKYKMTASGIPFVTNSEALTRVVVEAYEVPDNLLPSVDGLEGYNANDHEGSWYKRTPIKATLDTGEEIDASIYFNDDEGSTLIETGDYEDYRR